MNIHSGRFRAGAFALLAASATLCFAVETQVWEQAEPSEFEHGILHEVSVRSDGRVTLAPVFKELDSTNVPYLWAVAQDSKGTLYYGGGAPTGATAKVIALPPGGNPRMFAELTGLEVHALAVDAEDRVYAAVDPNAKIYRIGPGGKPHLFFEPKAKYIWAMAFDRAGNLFVATGDAGLIYKVTPDGEGSVFFDTGETHVRSMIVDAAGNLIVGTEPSGLVMRVTPQGKGFVLYQTDKREVTAVAEHDGEIYAAAVGNKNAPAPANRVLALLSRPPAPSHTGVQTVTIPARRTIQARMLHAELSGGSDLYRIASDGYAERIWKSSSALIYAITFDKEGRPLLGTGNKGVIYRVDSDHLSTRLLNAPPSQVTAFLQGKNGVVYATTGNVGNVYAIGPGLAQTGTVTSQTFDAHDFSYWGKLHLLADLRGGAIGVETRSGNTSNPQNRWSAWSKVALSSDGGQIESPPARFLQYRLKLACGGADSPELSAVDVAYLPKNIAPKVRAIEIGPYNYREAPGSTSEEAKEPSGSPASVTLPAMGQKASSSAPAANVETPGAEVLQYRKGYLTLRWSASDANGDPMLYKVEIQSRSPKTSYWRLLKARIRDGHYSFDTDTLPDGKYVARVTASDAPANTPQTALHSSLASGVFVIDNTPPVWTLDSMVKNGSNRTLKLTAKDALSWVVKAEYSINGGPWKQLAPLGKVSDARELDYELTGKAGQIAAVRVFDENDNVAVRQYPLK
ncbi:MAG TPA: hypothetical protein VF283_11090 [Bryobacteraceae bacterium]